MKSFKDFLNNDFIRFNKIEENKSLLADLLIGNFYVYEDDEFYYVKYNKLTQKYFEAYNVEIELTSLPNEAILVLKPSNVMGLQAIYGKANKKVYELYKNNLDLVESSLNKLKQYYDNYQCAMMSAFRGSKTYKENKSNSIELKNYFLSLGYTVIKVRGVYVENYKTPEAKEVSEVSYFVVNIKNDKSFIDNIISQGKKYNQDSVFIWDQDRCYLYGTNNATYPGFNKKEYQGNLFFSKEGQFMTKVNGRPFTALQID